MQNKQLDILKELEEGEGVEATEPYRNAVGELLPWEEPAYIAQQLLEQGKNQQGKKN